MECSIASINSNDTTIKQIFQSTKVIAVVGCSPDAQKASHRVAKYLQQKGFTIIPIYPKEDLILGQKVYRELNEIEENIDMVIVFRKPSFVMAVVQSCIQKGGIKYLWTQLGIVNDEAAQIAQENGMIVVQNKCAMIEHQKLL